MVRIHAGPPRRDTLKDDARDKAFDLFEKFLRELSELTDTPSDMMAVVATSAATFAKACDVSLEEYIGAVRACWEHADAMVAQMEDVDSNAKPD